MRPKPTAPRSCCARASSRPWCRAGIGRARCRWSPACAAVRAAPARSPWLRACYAQSAPLCLLLDAWYRRGSLIRTALRLGHEVIGQAIPPCSRCHHRASPEGAAGSMARALMPMWLQHCPPRSTPSPAMAGPAAPCRVSPALPQGRHRPWCELAKGSGWTKVRLLLSTDPTLSAPAIVEAYSKRWSIEPLVRDLKMVDGLGAMWQRGRTTLLRWLHLVQIARTPADREGRAARPDPPRRLAPGGDPDPGQGCTRGTLPEFRGFPPATGNLPKIGTCTLHRSPSKRRGCLNAAQIQLLQDFNDR